MSLYIIGFVVRLPSHVISFKLKRGFSIDVITYYWVSRVVFFASTRHLGKTYWCKNGIQFDEWYCWRWNFRIIREREWRQWSRRTLGWWRRWRISFQWQHWAVFVRIDVFWRRITTTISAALNAESEDTNPASSSHADGTSNCSCGVCTYLDNEPVNIFCQSRELVKDHIEREACIPQTEDFKLVCLYRTILKTALGVWHHSHAEEMDINNNNYSRVPNKRGVIYNLEIFLAGHCY